MAHFQIIKGDQIYISVSIKLGLVVALGVSRKFSLLDFFLVPSQGLQGVGFEMRVGFDELGGEVIE